MTKPHFKQPPPKESFSSVKLRRPCFCLNVRTGCRFSGALCILWSLVALCANCVNYALSHEQTRKDKESAGEAEDALLQQGLRLVYLAALIAFSLFIFFTILMLVAINDERYENQYMLLSWLIFASIFIPALLLSLVVYLKFPALFRKYKYRTMSHFVIHVATVPLVVYCLLCVNTEYMNTRERFLNLRYKRSNLMLVKLGHSFEKSETKTLV